MRIKILNLDDVPDSVGETFDPEGLEVPESVPVSLHFFGADYIGTAITKKESDGVYADIRLNPGVTLEDVLDRTPATGGTLISVKGGRINSAKLQGLVLSTDENADRRIKTVRQQLAGQEG